MIGFVITEVCKQNLHLHQSTPIYPRIISDGDRDRNDRERDRGGGGGGVGGGVGGVGGGGGGGGGSDRDRDRERNRIGDWSEHVSSSGKKYYYNCKTEVSQWEKPKEWLDKEG